MVEAARGVSRELGARRWPAPPIAIGGSGDIALMSANLATILTDTVEKLGDKTAFKLDDTELSYGCSTRAARAIAGLLKAKGVEPGDRVGLMLPNVPYFPVVYYGILRAGGVVVPMNVLLKGREVAFYLEDPGAKVLFAWHDFAEAAEAGAEEAGAEVILVEPGEFEQLAMARRARPGRGRARRRRHRGDPLHVRHHRQAEGRRAHARQPARELRGRPRGRWSRSSADDVILGALPLFHSFGQTCALNGARQRRRAA